MARGVLIIEDEATLAKNMCIYLVRTGFDVVTAETAEQGFAELESFKPDIVLLDFRLPGMDGMEALARLRDRAPGIPVIMITGHGTVELAVEAMKAGAYDFLVKPVSLAKLRLLVERALGAERREQALSYYQKREAAAGNVDGMVGDSEPMRRLKARLAQLLEVEKGLRDADAPAVLIVGETGTGKEVAARALHFSGPRREQPFVEINCAAIPSQLLESELFGHEKGAFTDAKERKPGLVETASGGTLFLDEIGDLDLGLQAKLLKLLEEKTVRRLGALRDQKVDVRIVAATHRPLPELVAQGRFRADLYYRLRIVELSLPPLRDRGDDIILLARRFLGVQAARYGRGGLSLSPQAERRLLAHRWPGNVRELRNLMEQAVLLAPGPVLEAEDLHLGITGPEREAGPGVSVPAGGSLEDIERGLLHDALVKSGWNVTQAARSLGISRDTLRYRIEKHGLSARD
ncbi:MAG: sigma-54-dependent Fis family transcriptional regulator [Rhodocyclaceae bacterium]|nr:sigma-54-dependent Fis family transcriptional regulator [Rhodocyclaceae bacterium]